VVLGGNPGSRTNAAKKRATKISVLANAPRKPIVDYTRDCNRVLRPT